MPVDPKIQSSKSFPFAEYASNTTGAVADSLNPVAINLSSGGLPVSLRTDEGTNVSLGVRSLKALAKFLGFTQLTNTFNETTLFTNANYGAGVKMEGEAPWSAVRFWAYNRAANGITGIKIIVGVTEQTDYTTNAANAFHPVSGGVIGNTLVSGAGNINSYMPVTFGGVTPFDLAAANLTGIVRKSDWIPKSSIPRADGGTRPLLLWRVEQVGGGGNGFYMINNAGLPLLRTPIQAFRGRIMQLFNGTNMVTNVAAVNGAATTVVMEIFPEFHYTVPCVNVCGLGDSIFQQESISLTGLITSFGQRACFDVSTPAKPYQYTSCAAAGKTSTEYVTRFREWLTEGYRPDVVIAQSASVNNYSGDIANMAYWMAKAKADTLDLWDLFQEYQVKDVFFTPLLPYNVLTLTDDNKRKEFNTWLAAFCARVGARFLDISAAGDGASPERWVPAYNSASDGIHPNELFVESVMTPQTAKLLAAVQA